MSVSIGTENQKSILRKPEAKEAAPAKETKTTAAKTAAAKTTTKK